jgi:hypothetical protein
MLAAQAVAVDDRIVRIARADAAQAIKMHQAQDLAAGSRTGAHDLDERAVVRGQEVTQMPPDEVDPALIVLGIVQQLLATLRAQAALVGIFDFPALLRPW